MKTIDAYDIRCKAKLAVKGFNQIVGADNTKILSPILQVIWALTMAEYINKELN